MNIKYLNSYPIYKGNVNTDSSGAAIDQTSINNTILDFHNAMIRAGFIRTNITPQLDIQNIPVFDYRVNNTKTYFEPIDIFTYSPLIYTFNDELNVRHPLYLKFTFSHKMTTGRNSSAVTSKLNNTVLALSCTISKTSTFDISINLSPFFYYSSASAYYAIVSDNKISFSEILNDKNILFMNICPHYSVREYNNTPSTEGVMNNLFNMILNRKEDGDVIVLCHNQVSTPPSSSISMGGTCDARTYYLDADNTLYTDEFGYFFDSFIQSNATTLDTNIYSTPAVYTTQSSNKHTDDILIINRSFTASKSKNSYYKVQMPDGSVNRYKLIGYPAYTFRFWDTVKSVLIKINDPVENV